MSDVCDHLNCMKCFVQSFRKTQYFIWFGLQVGWLAGRVECFGWWQQIKKPTLYIYFMVIGSFNEYCCKWSNKMQITTEMCRQGENLY